MEQQCDMGECLKPDKNSNYVAVLIVKPETGKSEVTFKYKNDVNKKTEALVDTDDIEMKGKDVVLKDKAVEKVKEILEKLVVKPMIDTKNKPLKGAENKKKNKGKNKRKKGGKKIKVIRRKCKKGKKCKG